MDVVLQAVAPTYSALFSSLFQSLFWWMWFFKSVSKPYLDQALLVSILVLMDVVLQAYFWFPAPCFPVCFNPCFDGCGSSNFVRPSSLIVGICFNPCFDGCGSSRRTFYFKPCLFTEFQSLFWWMWFFKSSFLRWEIFRHDVSILVLMDVVLQACTPIFLPLFWDCFNPCFDGCGSSSFYGEGLSP